MTRLYFIRHAQVDASVRDGATRPLTAKGLRDRALVTRFLQGKCIDAVLSSPYKRAVDTVADFAEKSDLAIITVPEFCERRGDSDMPRSHPHFRLFQERQWADFRYTYSDGECLAEVQERNIAALNRVLAAYRGRNIAIGTHGTALATILNHYDPAYGFKEFTAMVHKLPWAAVLSFHECAFVDMQLIDFHMEVHSGSICQ